MNTSGTRRDFIKQTGVLGASVLAAQTAHAASSTDNKPGTTTSETMKPSPRYMGDFAAEKIDTVRCAFIGVGSRGRGHARQIAGLEGVEVVAICDLYKDLAEKSAVACRKSGQTDQHPNISLYHQEEDDWKQMLEKEKPDAVFIATPWRDHAPMAIHAMESGAHAFVEVPLALTTQEMWDIVNTSERTQKHCMMMENVNYGQEELLFLNMCRMGAIGQILHGEASYIHRLVGQMRHVDRGTGSWRTPHYAHRDGNLYPTHGLGPVAQYMNLARGEDTFESIVSYSSPALGRQAYAAEQFPPEHQWNQLEYKGGDMNTSIIRTKLGRTIMLQWDETSPRPYSRHNLIQGTQGCLAGFPTRVALQNGVEGATTDAHKWAEGDQLKPIYKKYNHPLYQRVGPIAKQKGGHGGMDYIMRYRIIECLRNGQPLDQNIYEGAFWSVIAPLSEASVAQGGAPKRSPISPAAHGSKPNRSAS